VCPSSLRLNWKNELLRWLGAGSHGSDQGFMAASSDSEAECRTLADISDEGCGEEDSEGEIVSVPAAAGGNKRRLQASSSVQASTRRRIEDVSSGSDSDYSSKISSDEEPALEGRCGALPRSSSGVPASELAWTCTVCTYRHESEAICAKSCEVCGTIKPLPEAVDLDLQAALQAIDEMEARSMSATSKSSVITSSSSSRSLAARAGSAFRPLCKDEVQVVFTGKTLLKSNARVTIVSYDLVSKLTAQLNRQRFKIIVCDESHYIKNSDAKRSQVLIPLIQQATRAILLSGKKQHYSSFDEYWKT
jgi:hypothetical protein